MTPLTIPIRSLAAEPEESIAYMPMPREMATFEMPSVPEPGPDSDVAGATHIFAIGCTLPDKALASGKASDWSDVPDDQGYAPMRDAIVRHVKALLDELKR